MAVDAQNIPRVIAELRKPEGIDGRALTHHLARVAVLRTGKTGTSVKSPEPYLLLDQIVTK